MTAKKGDIVKIYRAVTACYKATIIPMLRWSFIRAGFGLNLADLFVPFTVNRVMVLN
jgi:hypothetical protein